MDIGLNNKNYLHLKLQNPYLEDIEWLVEATSDEQFNLWKHHHSKYNWVSVSLGYSYQIVELEIKGNDKIKSELLPVWISFSFAIIDGHKICFYTSDSRLVHHGYIDAFLGAFFQRTHDNYTRWNHTNSMNFHNCIGNLTDIDKKPRKTIFEPENEYHIWNIKSEIRKLKLQKIKKL